MTLAKSYEPYGSVLNSTGSATSIFGYAGEQFDTTGLIYLRARYMQPTLGIFLSRDLWEGEVMRPRSMNGWSYTEGNPVNRVDPSGRRECYGYAPPTMVDNGGGVGVDSCQGGEWPLPPDDPVKLESRAFGVPWQVVAGVLEAEKQEDTGTEDFIETEVDRAFPWSSDILDLTGIYPDPGTGIGNIHVSTAKSVAKYFQDYYASCYALQLRSIKQNSRISQIAWQLTNDRFSIKVMAAYVRQLADYRFGSNEKPLIIAHANLAEWTITDAVAIWHGYRYGVPKISPGGKGFRNLVEFQNRSYSLDEFVNNIVQGDDAQRSARASVPIFEKYFGMADN